MLAALLGQYPQANFLITAYTTESTKEQNSEQLSLQRANALGEELVKAGVDGKRITIMGMGNKPAADKSSAAQQKNQRIEISVIQ
jgi:outer membrane protein OmpA-like peptidoglycan-associated protein